MVRCAMRLMCDCVGVQFNLLVFMAAIREPGGVGNNNEIVACGH